GFFLDRSWKRGFAVRTTEADRAVPHTFGPDTVAEYVPSVENHRSSHALRQCLPGPLGDLRPRGHDDDGVSALSERPGMLTPDRRSGEPFSRRHGIPKTGLCSVAFELLKQRERRTVARVVSTWFEGKASHSDDASLQSPQVERKRADNVSRSRFIDVGNSVQQRRGQGSSPGF